MPDADSSTTATPTEPRNNFSLSCLLPDTFNGTTNLENYLTQFETVSKIAKWQTPDDKRPQYFALRLRGPALDYYTTLSTPQQQNYNQLVAAFRTQYGQNSEILKAKLKAAKQQPSQPLSAFLCEIRGLARQAYADPTVRDQLVLTTFIEGLSNPTLRWEVRKVKPTTADAALQHAVELQAFMEIENGQSIPGTPPSTPTGANNIQTRAPYDMSEMLTELVRVIRDSPPGYSSPRKRGRSYARSLSRPRFDKNPPDRDRSASRGSRSRDRQDSRNRRDGRDNKLRRDERYRTPDSRSRSRSQSRGPPPPQQRQPCRHCKRTNHSSRDCRACYNCGRLGHMRRNCPETLN